MYILVVSNQDKGVIEISEHVNLKNAKNDKRILLDRGEIACIFNKTFLNGIDGIKKDLLKHSKGKTNFIDIMEINDKIENIEEGLL